MELKMSTDAFFMVVESKLKSKQIHERVACITTKSDISASSILLISFAALCCVIFEIVKGQS